MNSLIQANNEKNQRLVSVSAARRSVELDFFTEASNNYRSYLMGEYAFNPNENESLTEMIKQDFIDLAQDPEDGIISKQTKLKIDKRNLAQMEIKQLQRDIDLYFSRLDSIIELGGYLSAAIEPIFPKNLPTFIANYDNLNINGTNERDRDRNMFMVAAWGDLFNYFPDVKVNKEYYFQPTQTNELVVFKQTVMFEIGGETFRKYLHLKPYI